MFKHGWKMHEIDEMDHHFFHELMKPEIEEKVYIDQVLP